MKLLFDENLSPKLARALATAFPGSAHVHECGLGHADDDAIWQFATLHGFVVVSKDLDFYERSVLKGSPPKVIWLRTGNCSTDSIAQLLGAYAAEIVKFESRPDEAFLILP